MQTNVILYCKLCKYLSPKEHEQTSKKEKHICQKYSKQVKHLGHHPELPRLPECDEPMHDYRSGMQVRHLTPLALDAAMPPSAEPDSGLESVSAVEFDTQPRK